MSYGTSQLMTLEDLKVEFDTAVIENNKTKAFKILKQMAECGLSTRTQDILLETVYNMVADHPGERLLPVGDDTPEITQESMNGSFAGINSGNHD